MDEISLQKSSHRTVVTELSEESRARRAVPYTKTGIAAYPLATRHCTTCVFMSAPAENQINGTTVYYAVGVYPETRGGATKGIPVFEAPRKNVVAIFYHELNEARTDPDVEQVIGGGSTSLLGWTSRQGEEYGDFPVFQASLPPSSFRKGYW